MIVHRLALVAAALLIAGLPAAPVLAQPESGAAASPAPATPGSAPSAPAKPAPAKPVAADLLFEDPHFAHAAPGTPLIYRYNRMVSDPELGPTFSDRIGLLVEASASGDAARDVKVDFFSGERHRAAGPFEGVSTNPVLMIFLENHVADLAGRLKGNPRYFKNAIRAALMDSTTVAPAELTVDGQTYAGWRITVRPFMNDANASRMRGLDALTYTFDLAPGLPGGIARVEIAAQAPGGRLWEESIAYDPKGI